MAMKELEVCGGNLHISNHHDKHLFLVHDKRNYSVEQINSGPFSLGMVQFRLEEGFAIWVQF